MASWILLTTNKILVVLLQGLATCALSCACIADIPQGIPNNPVTSLALSTAALERIKYDVRYDGAYVSIAYPMGDVAADTGVCTDVVIRSYRALGIDLQQLVHEDMRIAFDKYPSKRIWGMSRADSNIDHRRVPNLQAFFTRHGQSLDVSQNASAYRPGDLVTWMLPGNLPHIGIVTEQVSASTGKNMVVHNIGAGPVLDDMLFDYKITGHYRFKPAPI